MYKKVFSLVFFAFISIMYGESKNVVSAFLSYFDTKINSKNEISKIIKIGNGMVCLLNDDNSTYNECACTFKKLNEFEMNCVSNFKKSQEEAKNCSIEHCEICCNLISSKNMTNSILDYELDCKKKCTKNNTILSGNQNDYKLAFQKIVEFIRIFYPPTVLNYHPIENKKVPKYTNKVLGSKYDRIIEDLKAGSTMINEQNDSEETNLNVDDEFESLFLS
ncbi:secreted ookinete protein, putative [Hepatocystis sp. ex Piliocolobus tephrosceles]|nr:secreted ookinete protein, putative [Hepatocystis sp. ex Piliocolobus tephrosceles]